MKQLLLLVVISSFAIGLVGCKGGADETAVTTPSGTAGAAGTPPAATDPNKAGVPQASTATPTMSPNASDPRWKAGSMLKGGK